MTWIEERMEQALEARRSKGTIRRMPATPSSADDGSSDGSRNDNEEASRRIDFSSNDYLGLAQDPEQAQFVENEFQKLVSLSSSSSARRPQFLLGATGSRLLSGDGRQFHQLEAYLAGVHNRPAALLFNSGYDANLSVVSCLACDIMVHDEYAHNSLHMGMRLWQSPQQQQQQQQQRRTMPFQHNNARDLQRQLQRIREQQQHDNDKSGIRGNSSKPPRVVVLIESVYSMDGDVAPLQDILDMAALFGALVVVDEAHGLGVYGHGHAPPPPPPPTTTTTTTTTTTNHPHLDRHDGLPLGGTGVLAALQLEHHPALVCSIHTFGKGAGCHGAVVCFSSVVHKEYLVNYGYPLIYSTAMPLHSLVTIRCSYETMTGRRGDELRETVFGLIQLFRSTLEPLLLQQQQQQQQQHGNNSNSSNHTVGGVRLLPSTSPIQALIVPGNQTCRQFCHAMWQRSDQRIRLYPILSPTVPAGQERARIILHAHNTVDQVLLLVRLLVQCLRDLRDDSLQEPSSWPASLPGRSRHHSRL